MSTRSAFLAAGVAIAAAIFLLRPASDLSRDLGEAVADMILANATIYTADPAMPFAEAMAVRAGRVLRVGGYYSVKELKGRHTMELNLSGNVVLPGFIDSHVHFIDGGLQRGCHFEGLQAKMISSTGSRKLSKVSNDYTVPSPVLAFLFSFLKIYLAS